MELLRFFEIFLKKSGISQIHFHTFDHIEGNKTRKSDYNAFNGVFSQYREFFKRIKRQGYSIDSDQERNSALGFFAIYPSYLQALGLFTRFYSKKL